MTLVGLGMIGGSAALLWGFAGSPPRPTTTAKAPAPAPAPAPVPAAPPAPPTAPGDIVQEKDLAAAIERARPDLTDDRTGPSRGAKLLVRYAAAKLAWNDLVIAKNETSLALVEKDPATAIGKRLCASGTLQQIEKQSVDGTDAFLVLLTTKTGDQLAGYAVGDTGDLVKRKPAKFCGVVTGRLDRAGKATFAVGMVHAP